MTTASEGSARLCMIENGSGCDARAGARCAASAADGCADTGAGTLLPAHKMRMVCHSTSTGSHKEFTWANLLAGYSTPLAVQCDAL